MLQVRYSQQYFFPGNVQAQAKPRSSINQSVPYFPVLSILSNEPSKLDALNSLLKNTETLHMSVPSEPDVLVTKEEQNGSARSILFGVFIAASIAIKNNTKDVLKLQETLSIVHDATLALKDLYEQGWGKLEIQSKAFPRTCNAIIEMIEAIKSNQIQTTELILLACQNYNLESKDSINLAIADISHYLLYLEANEYVQTNMPAEASEETKVRLIRDNETATTMTDLLRTGIAYNNFERSLVCQRLKICSSNINIDLNGVSSLTEEGCSIDPFSFITVTARGHTTLLLDKNIIQQIQQESHLYHRPLEAFYLHRKPGIVYYPILNPKDTLHAMRVSFIHLCNEAKKSINNQTFKAKFNQACTLFLEHLRPLTWRLHTKDILWELEQRLYPWQIKTLSDTNILEKNKTLVNQFLRNIYIGNLEPLLLADDEMQIRFYIGGMSNGNQDGLVDLGLLEISPLQHQQLTLFIEGINRTIVHARSSDCKQNFRASLVYLSYLTELVLITPADKKTIKQALFNFCQTELNTMPQHRIEHNQPGYAAAQQEQINIDKTLGLFTEGLNKINTLEPYVYHLKIRPIDDIQLSLEEDPQWPFDLETFEQSIEPNTSCKDDWEQRFRDNPDYAVTYFCKVRDLMDNAPNAVRIRVSSKLLNFSEQLKRRSHYFAINMMEDVALHASSPTNNALYPDVSSEFYSQQIKARHPVDNADIQSVRVITTGKSDETLRAEELVSQLKRLLNSCSQHTEAFEEHFDVFNAETNRFITDYRQDTEKLLINFKKTMFAIPDSLKNKHFMVLDEHIKRIQERCKNPLPEHLSSELGQLKNSYMRCRIGNDRRSLKHFFLNDLERQIIENPAVSYGECIRIVSDDSLFKTLFSSRTTCSHFFFGTNKLNDFLQRLKALDPVEENIQANKLTSHDVGAPLVPTNIGP